ncbi:UNVERIFIED_CONTAM: Transcription factor [Sesamum calycinum]|uniref:Transcription factor n=1 Tax=Sesamum calycinum TaxID=2727403 RepID=A0AAW2LRQ3_9LAMI
MYVTIIPFHLFQTPFAVTEAVRCGFGQTCSGENGEEEEMSEEKEDGEVKETPFEAGMDEAMVVDGGVGEAEEGGGVKGKVRGPWSPHEDAILSGLVSKFGARNWSLIARGIPGRSGKSCRLRWCNQLDPCVKRKPFTGKVLMILLQELFSGI